MQIRANNLYDALDGPNVGVIPGLKAIMEHESIPIQPLLDPAVSKRLLDIYEANIDNRLQPVR